MSCLLLVAQSIALRASGTIGKSVLFLFFILFFERFNCNLRKKELDSMLGDSSPSDTKSMRWVAKFKMSWTNTTDAPCVGHPTEVTTSEKILKIILADESE